MSTVNSDDDDDDDVDDDDDNDDDDEGIPVITVQLLILSNFLYVLIQHADGFMETAGLMAESVEKIFHLSEQVILFHLFYHY